MVDPMYGRVPKKMNCMHSKRRDVLEPYDLRLIESHQLNVIGPIAMVAMSTDWSKVVRNQTCVTHFRQQNKVGKRNELIGKYAPDYLPFRMDSIKRYRKKSIKNNGYDDDDRRWIDE